MITALGAEVLSKADRQALQLAVTNLENPNFAARIADYAGVPVNRVLGMLPKIANHRLSAMVRAAIVQGLDVAIDTLDDVPPPVPATGFSSFLAGVTGGLGGLFGFVALPVELPVTTTLMLRAIAAIARHEGEDLSKIEARLACLEVFAYGAKRSTPQLGRQSQLDMGNVDLGYYAARALLNKYTNEVAALAFERGAIEVSAPVVGGLVSEIASRFGLVVSDKLAAGAVPILGALGGATVNVLFMAHFQRIAQGHFTLRRLERSYGGAVIRQRYAELAAAPRQITG